MMHYTKPTTAIVILGYNSRSDIPHLFASLAADQTIFSHVYFVDNASPDASDDAVAWIQQRYPDVQCFSRTTNAGYAGAHKEICQKLFDVSGYESVVLLNPDIVVSAGWLDALITVANERPHAGAIQPLILLREHGKNTEIVNTSGNLVHFLGTGYIGGYGSVYAGEGSAKSIPTASGAALFLTKEAYMIAGGFDEQFFLYAEDQDLCWRMRLQGYDCMIAPQSVVHHNYTFDNQKQPEKIYYLERNRFFFVIKNYSLSLIAFSMPALVLFEIALLIFHGINGNFRIKMRAYKDCFIALKDVIKKRKMIQKKRIVKDAVLIDYLASGITLTSVDSLPLKAVNLFFLIYWKGCKALYKKIFV